MQTRDNKLLSDIEEYGWHVIMVIEDEEGPGFAYSIGLYRVFHHPEIIVFGLPLDVMHEIINVIGNEVKSGARFLAINSYNGIVADYPVAFREMAKHHYDQYLGQAIGYYQYESFPTLQCFWQSKHGHFPWETGYPESLKAQQPILND
jgi:Domain of unknown function (DUF4262)